MTAAPSGFDAVVIGLGPAGALIARQLALAGLDVLAVERASFPRYKVCGGCLNAKSIHQLEEAGIDVRALGGVPIGRFEGGFGRHRVSLELPGGLAISRAALDSSLADAARAAGASVRFNTSCVEIAPSRKGVGIALDANGERIDVFAKTVIGADGLSGIARKCTGRFATVTAPHSRLGVGVLLAPCGFYEAGVIYMAVGRAGYVGLTVVEHDCLNVAAALDSSATRESGSPARVAESILLETGFPVPDDILNAPWKGTPPLSQSTRPVAADGIFLVGDATGYVEPFTGEGMAWALEGALELAPIVVDRVKSGDPTSEERWNRTHARRFGAAQRRCRLIARGLRSAGITATVAQVLAAMPGLAGPVIGRLNAVVE